MGARWDCSGFFEFRLPDFRCQFLLASVGGWRLARRDAVLVNSGTLAVAATVRAGARGRSCFVRRLNERSHAHFPHGFPQQGSERETVDEFDFLDARQRRVGQFLGACRMIFTICRLRAADGAYDGGQAEAVLVRRRSFLLRALHLRPLSYIPGWGATQHAVRYRLAVWISGATISRRRRFSSRGHRAMAPRHAGTRLRERVCPPAPFAELASDVPAACGQWSSGAARFRSIFRALAGRYVGPDTVPITVAISPSPGGSGMVAGDRGFRGQSRHLPGHVQRDDGPHPGVALLLSSPPTTSAACRTPWATSFRCASCVPGRAGSSAARYSPSPAASSNTISAGRFNSAIQLRPSKLMLDYARTWAKAGAAITPSTWAAASVPRRIRSSSSKPDSRPVVTPSTPGSSSSRPINTRVSRSAAAASARRFWMTSSSPSTGLSIWCVRRRFTKGCAGHLPNFRRQIGGGHRVYRRRRRTLGRRMNWPTRGTDGLTLWRLTSNILNNCAALSEAKSPPSGVTGR